MSGAGVGNNERNLGESSVSLASTPLFNLFSRYLNRERMYGLYVQCAANDRASRRETNPDGPPARMEEADRKKFPELLANRARSCKNRHLQIAEIFPFPYPEIQHGKFSGLISEVIRILGEAGASAPKLHA